MTNLAPKSAQALTTAIYFSLQSRADYLLETHLPSLTRALARGVDTALRAAYTKALGADLLDPQGQVAGQQDPTFIRDLMGLKASAGGGGYRNTERRAPFLNAINKVLPQTTGDRHEDPGLWPSLASMLGKESFHSGGENKRWERFFQSSNPWAEEMKAEIERVKTLQQSALAAAGLGEAPPTSEVFDQPAEGFGAGIKKLHKDMFDEIRKYETEAMRARASKLPPSDQRKLAFEQSRACRFSNVLFAGTPSIHARFSNTEFHIAVQSVLGAPLSLLRPYIGMDIDTNDKHAKPRVDPYGNNIKKLNHAKGGGTTQNHNTFVNLLSYWLSRAGVPHRGGRHGKPTTCKDLFTHINPGRTGGERVLQEIIPDIRIDGRFIDTTLEGTGAQLFGSVRTLADIKTKSCDDKYARDSSGAVSAVVNKKQGDVNKDYHRKAKALDDELGTDQDCEGPYVKELKTYGKSGGEVVAPVVGAFGEMSEHVYAIVDLVATLLGEEHCRTYSDKPATAKAMYTQRIRRSLGLAAHLGWARLLSDRLRDLVQTPAFPRNTTSSAPGMRQDEEDSFEREIFLNPDFNHHAQ